MKTPEEYAKDAYQEHATWDLKRLTRDFADAIATARREERAATVKECGKVITDLLAAMPESTIFPVARGLLKRVSAGIAALAPADAPKPGGER